MNFYALNTTPLNGWETHIGSGIAAVSIAASGASATVHLGSGTAATVVASTGNGTRRAQASGSAQLVVSAAGNGIRRAPAFGSAAVELRTEGSGEIVSGLGGQAQIRVISQGMGGILVYGDGAAPIVVAQTGEGRAANGRFGVAHGIIETRAWDIPKSYDTYHGSGISVVRFNTQGVSAAIAKNGGAASLAIQAEGVGRLASRVHGDGNARIELVAARSQSEQQRQVFANGAAAMHFKIATRDNRVVMLPDSFYSAPKARGLRVTHENRGMRVPRQPVAHQLAEA